MRVSKKTLLTLCVVAFLFGLMWVVSTPLSMGMKVLILGSPFVLALLSLLWGLESDRK